MSSEAENCTDVGNCTQETDKKCQYNSLDISKALKQYIGGMTQSDIARLHGVSRQVVNVALKPFKFFIDNPSVSKAYDNHRDTLLSAGQAKLLVAALDDRAIKKSSTLQLASSFGILFDKQRLIRGEATENINIKSITQHLQTKLDQLNEQEKALLDAQ